EAHDLAADEPQKLRSLIQTWFEEAGRYDVLPLDDRFPIEILNDPRPQPLPPQDTYTYYPHAAEVPATIAPNIRGRSYRVLASVDLDSADASGVLMASGSRHGGHALFLKDRKLWYVYNFLGIEEQRFVSSQPIDAGSHVVGMEFTKQSMGEHHESIGSTRLFIDSAVVAESPMRAPVGSVHPC